jgi:hypothetical protein
VREADAAVQRNSDQYEQILKYIQQMNWRRAPEKVLRFIKLAADFASHNHTGRFADGAIENIILQIGLDLDALLPKQRLRSPGDSIPELRKSSRRHVVHVITWALPAGGPTRTLRNWIELDADSCSSVVLVDQGRFEVPHWLEGAVARSGGELLRIPDDYSILARAKWLREVTRSADLVVLHTYTFDVVPGIAFAVPGGPPVAMVNHSDHIFWLNGSITDLVVHQRDVSTEIAAERRFARNEVVLPHPLLEPDPSLTKAEARRRLGIPESQTVLLSVGSVWKLFPTRTHNFRNTALKILERNPRAHLYLLAWDWGFKPDFLFGCKHDRFHFFPDQVDASPYQAAADVYLEGFPFGAQTSMLEAALRGMPCVRAFAPECPLMVATDAATSAVIDSPLTEEQYVQRVSDFVSNPAERERVGKRLRESVRDSHVGSSWRARLEDVYRRLQALPHLPRPIPETRCKTTPTDRAICSWQQAKVMYLKAAGRADNAPDSALAECLWGEAYRTRQRGHYMTAFRFLRCLCAIEGWKVRYLAGMLKLLPHKVLSMLRVLKSRS